MCDLAGQQDEYYNFREWVSRVLLKKIRALFLGFARRLLKYIQIPLPEKTKPAKKRENTIIVDVRQTNAHTNIFFDIRCMYMMRARSQGNNHMMLALRCLAK